MILEQSELLDIENLLKSMRKCSFKELEGREALAFARAYALLLEAFNKAKTPAIKVEPVKEVKKKK